MPRIESSWKTLSWAVSIALGVLILFLGAFRNPYTSPYFHHSIALAIAVSLLPPAVLDILDYRWRKAIDRALPRLLEGVAHAQLTGLSLLRAFREAGEGVSGPLRDEVRLMMAKISWGMSFEDALRMFMERAGTPLARRVATLIIEANRSGGLVERIFAPMAQATATFQAMEDERKAQLKPYMIITYMSFIIFLVITGVLYTQFFVPMASMPVSFGGMALTPNECWTMLYHMGIILGIFSGLMAGILGEGRAYGGLKHVIIMVLMTYVAFRYMIEPGWLLGLFGFL